MPRRLVLSLALSVSSVACAAASGAPGDEGESASPRMVERSQAAEPVTLGDALDDRAATHLAVSLRVQHEDDLDALLRDQQNPASPLYHAWLTPEQYGERFGLPEALYARLVGWLEGEGLSVTPYPNRLFAEATGTVAQVRSLLGVQLRSASKGERHFRSYSGGLRVPADLDPYIVKVGGLDTRVRLRHRLALTFEGEQLDVLDADDLRTLYDVPSGSPGASGLTLVVLGTQEGTQAHQYSTPGPPFVAPSATAIQSYLSGISHASATFNPIVLSNPDDDLDYAGSNAEYQLDVEMQSVGAPNAKNIDLVLSPASLVLQTGAQYVVNSLSDAVVVSSSLGLCESEEVGYDGGALSDTTGDAYLMQQATKQGLSEGQTWFAASGDTGADDCYDKTSGTGDGYGGGNATVDFPCSLPEIVCVGGTQFAGPGQWSSSGALQAYETEVACNEGARGVGGGGGQSKLFAKPSYQQGVGPEAQDGRRDVPDIAFVAASAKPGVMDYDCGQGQDSCADAGSSLPGADVVGGTSVASPLAAGFFANLAGGKGCRLGDIHATLYSLGAAQQKGGAAPFHDITTGSNTWTDPGGQTIHGFSAVSGYDLVTGWGSVDMTKLATAWPSCTAGGGTLSSSGSTGSGSSSGGKGCGCRAAGAGPSGSWPAAGLTLGILGLGFRRRRTGDCPETECPGWRRGARRARREEGA
jgi:MYXO-CTERM domain-containing protein